MGCPDRNRIGVGNAVGREKSRPGRIFSRISSSNMSGLLGEYYLNNADRSLSFVRSVERYSALTGAINTTEESGGKIGLENWKCVFFSQYIR